MGPEGASRFEVFSGWKEIANYLGKGVRTVQRYERELALPIHRPSGKSAGSVITTKVELDGWVAASPVREMPNRYGGHPLTNKVRVDFLLINSQIALTFSGIALQATNSEHKRHTAQTARKAYDTIMRLRDDVALSDAQRDQLEANLRRLKSELLALGQTVPS